MQEEDCPAKAIKTKWKIPQHGFPHTSVLSLDRFNPNDARAIRALSADFRVADNAGGGDCFPLAFFGCFGIFSTSLPPSELNSLLQSVANFRLAFLTIIRMMQDSAYIKIAKHSAEREEEEEVHAQQAREVPPHKGLLSKACERLWPTTEAGKVRYRSEASFRFVDMWWLDAMATALGAEVHVLGDGMWSRGVPMMALSAGHAHGPTPVLRMLRVGAHFLTIYDSKSTVCPFQQVCDRMGFGHESNDSPLPLPLLYTQLKQQGMKIGANPFEAFFKHMVCVFAR